MSTLKVGLSAQTCGLGLPLKDGRHRRVTETATNGELDERSNRCARLFRAAGSNVGDAVADPIVLKTGASVWRASPGGGRGDPLARDLAAGDKELNTRLASPETAGAGHR